MKHSLRITLTLLAWSAFAVILGLLAIPLKSSVPKAAGEVSPWILAAIIVAMILLGAVFWFFAMKKFKADTIDMLFAVGISMFITTFTARIVTTYFTISTWGMVAYSFIVYFGIYIAYATLIQHMQKSWVNTKKWLPLSNLIMVIVMAGAGATLGASLPSVVAVVVLGVAAIYDAWAVWKSGTMQVMAKFFLKRRVIPGIAIAKEQEEEFALLGGGDILFIVLVAASFWNYSHVMTYIAAAWMFGAVIFLFAISTKGKFYPALPFIFVGLICAYLTDVIRLALNIVW